MKCYVVDAFADHLFEGNPAAVCVLDTWLSDELMQLIAVENNLSETAFAVKNAGSYGLRWFTPGGEIDLCGHATLATAYVLMRFYEPNAGEISNEKRRFERQAFRRPLRNGFSGLCAFIRSCHRSNDGCARCSAA